MKKAPPPKKAAESPKKPVSTPRTQKSSGFPVFYKVLLALAIIAFIGLLYLLISPPPSLAGKKWPEPIARQETQKNGNLVYAGLPRALASNSEYLLLKNTGYWTGYSEYRKDPLWVAYRLDAQSQESPGKRPSKFSTDLRTRSRINHDDYDRTGMDRGHMAPNAGIANRFGREAQLETFLMSNIVPQNPNLNRKLWGKLERLESDTYAASRKGVWVINGPVFDKKRDFLPSGVEIPDAFFKIMIDETANDIDLQAFLIPQSATGKESPDQFLSNVDQIEKETALDFFPAITDAREERLESRTPRSLWSNF